MEYCGIDVHVGKSVICLLNEGGEVGERSTIRTTRVALGKYFEGRERMRIAIEAGGSSPWVSRLLEDVSNGCQVRVSRNLEGSNGCQDRMGARFVFHGILTRELGGMRIEGGDNCATSAAGVSGGRDVPRVQPLGSGCAVLRGGGRGACAR